jgi:hypothetical protein
MNKSFCFILFFITCLLINNSFSQVTQEWVAYYNGPGNSNDDPHSMVLDDSGNVVVAGESGGMLTGFMSVVKYNPSGIEQWTARHYSNGSIGAGAYSLKTDHLGNVYVTGTACTGSGSVQDIVTIKYDRNGTQLMIAVYHTPNASSRGSSIAIDSALNIYVTGTCNKTSDSSDIITIKYNPFGVQQWVQIYNGPTGNLDFGSKILVDHEGNIYVKGTSWVTPLFFEYVIIKYNSLGIRQWVIRQFGSDNTSNSRGSLALDRAGNIYLAACSGSAGMQCYLTAKYNSSGNIQWMSIYNTNNLPSQCETSDIVLDSSDNVYVTGYSWAPGNLSLQGCTTIKYNSAGAEQWVRIFNGNNNTAGGLSMAIDNDRNIYVTGGVDNGGQEGYDYFTLKYDSSGIQKWLKYYNGPGGNTDMPSAIVVDNLKNVYVTGWGSGPNSASDFATVKYSQPIGVEPIASEVPNRFSLYQNYPNPFNPTTKIKFSLPLPRFASGRPSKGGVVYVRLVIYDVLGKEVASLIPPLGGGQEGLNPGTYEVTWDAGSYPSGVYFYKLITAEYTETKKMVLVK